MIRLHSIRASLTASCVVALGVAFAGAPLAASGAAVHVSRASARSVPRPAHVVIVVEENKSYGDVIGNRSAPYLNFLARRGALFTRSFAVTHPSEPNYLALFSGSTQRLTDDSCPHRYATRNLGWALIHAGLTFTGYSESMPRRGRGWCWSGNYVRKHNPWVNFARNVPASSNRPLAAFPHRFSTLPTVSFVIPNLAHDMHDGSVATGDWWLRSHLGGYARWASTHNSLLIVTWDEDDWAGNNRIPTIFYGQPVKVGRYAQKITHYRVLRTIEDAYRLPRVGASRFATPIVNVWRHR